MQHQRDGHDDKKEQYATQQLHRPGGSQKAGIIRVLASDHALPDTEIGKHDQTEIQRIDSGDKPERLGQEQSRKNQVADETQQLTGDIAADEPTGRVEHP